MNDIAFLAVFIGLIIAARAATPDVENQADNQPSSVQTAYEELLDAEHEEVRSALASAPALPMSYPETCVILLDVSASMADRLGDIETLVAHLSVHPNIEHVGIRAFAKESSPIEWFDVTNRVGVPYAEKRRRTKLARQITRDSKAVSYTHLTLPTICSV